MSNAIQAAMGDDEVLAYTQSKRKAIVEQLTKSNAVPEDGSSRDTLLRALDGLDKSAFGQKRIKLEENAQGNVAAIMAGLLTHIHPNVRRGISDVIDVPTPTLGEDIPQPLLVPGETEISPQQLDYNSFMAGHNSSNSSSEDEAEF